MPIYMDLHIIPGVNAKDVAVAHSLDVYLEKDHNCTCLTYWVDEQKGHVFCLINAPSKEVVNELHSKSHGLVPHKIIEVESALVQSFLGRITDPENAQRTDDGFLLINEYSYRVVMMVKLPDPILMRHQMGKEADAWSQQISVQINEQILSAGGRMALQRQDGIIGSFTNAQEAIQAALNIHHLSSVTYSHSIAIHAGEPVSQHDKFFGDTLGMLQYMCFFEQKFPLRISNAVRELLIKERALKLAEFVSVSSASDDELLQSIISVLESRYAEPTLQIDDLAKVLAVSQSQLYRKTVALTGHSPNDLLRLYRLEKARQLLQKGVRHIAEVAFGNGFNSPSYFTKCFKEKFGITPQEYAALL